MAIVNLGNADIDIGALPTTYTPFAFRDNRAYLIYAITTIERPNNIFSYFRFRGIYTNSSRFSFYTHHVIEKPVSVRPFILLLPFSNLYDGNGTVTLEVERLPLTLGTADDVGTVNLQLEYDNADTVGTWL